MTEPTEATTSRGRASILSPLSAGVVVFGASAAVLVLEILAGRLLAPYVGVTLESFTGIIGTVLAGIAAGAWFGGRLSDRKDPRTLLGPMLVIGGVLAFLSIPVVDYLGASMRGARPAAGRRRHCSDAGADDGDADAAVHTTACRRRCCRWRCRSSVAQCRSRH